MALIVDPYDFTNGTTADAEQVDARFAAVLAQVNGNIDADNLAAAGVTKAKLATDALNTFLKLVTAADLVAKFGTFATGAFAALTGSSTATGTVTHGLGRTPLYVLFGNTHITNNSVSPSPLAPSVAVNGVPGATTFGWVASVEGSTNNGCTVYWLAVG